MTNYGHGAGGMHLTGYNTNWVGFSVPPKIEKKSSKKASGNQKPKKPQDKLTMIKKSIVATKENIEKQQERLKQYTNDWQRLQLQKKIKNLKKSLASLQVGLERLQLTSCGNIVTNKKSVSSLRAAKKTNRESSQAWQQQKDLQFAQITGKAKGLDSVHLQDKITIASVENPMDKISRTLVSPLEENPPTFQMFLGHRLKEILAYNGEHWSLIKIQRPDGRCFSTLKETTSASPISPAPVKIEKPKFKMKTMVQPKVISIVKKKDSEKTKSMPKVQIENENKIKKCGAHGNCLNFNGLNDTCIVTKTDCIMDYTICKYYRRLRDESKITNGAAACLKE